MLSLSTEQATARSAMWTEDSKAIALERLRRRNRQYFESCKKLPLEGRSKPFKKAMEDVDQLCQSLKAFQFDQSDNIKTIIDHNNSSEDTDRPLDKDTEDLQKHSTLLGNRVLAFARGIEETNDTDRWQTNQGIDVTIQSELEKLITMIGHQGSWVNWRYHQEQGNEIADTTFQRFHSCSKWVKKMSKKTNPWNSSIRPIHIRDATDARGLPSFDLDLLCSNPYVLAKYPAVAGALLTPGCSLSKETKSVPYDEVTTSRSHLEPDIASKFPDLYRSFKRLNGDRQKLFKEREHLRDLVRSITEYGETWNA